MTETSEPLLTPRQKAYLEANPDASMFDEHAVADQLSQKSKSSQRKGIGGLLAFAVFSCFFGPIVAFGLNYSNLRAMEDADTVLLASQNWMFAKSAVWGFFCFSAGLSVYAGHLLISSRAQSTVRIVILCIWSGGPIMTAVSAFALQGIGPELGQLFASMVMAAFWTTYFLTSRRVKNTYCENEGEPFQ